MRFQRGFVLPGVRGMGIPLAHTLPSHVEEAVNMLWDVEVEPVVQHAMSVLARHGGRLAALSVEAPHGQGPAVELALTDSLEIHGQTGVEIVVVEGPGPLRLLSVEVAR